MIEDLHKNFKEFQSNYPTKISFEEYIELNYSEMYI